MREIIGCIVEQGVTDPATENDTQDSVKKQIRDPLFIDVEFTQAGNVTHHEIATDKAEQVHHAVPSHAQGANAEYNRIDLGIIHIKFQS